MVSILCDVKQTLTALIDVKHVHQSILNSLPVLDLPIYGFWFVARAAYLDIMLNLRVSACVTVGLLCVQRSVQAEPIVAVSNGSYEGTFSPPFDQDFFLGIPYAQDAGGPNRFRIPQSLTETWTGTRSANNYSHACPDATPQADALYGMSENCLSISVVRPAGVTADTRLPVPVWIHGGSCQVGTSGLARYNLSYLVQQSVKIGKPIVATSINYRKGGWGNMYSVEIQGSGNTNIALRDMRKALAWISENILGFGGNPDSVTIWGGSS